MSWKKDSTIVRRLKALDFFHCFIPQSDNLLKCKFTSTSPDSELHTTGKFVDCGTMDNGGLRK